MQKGTMFIKYADTNEYIRGIVSFKNVKSIQRGKQILDNRTRTEKGKTGANIDSAWFVPHAGLKQSVEVMK